MSYTTIRFAVLTRHTQRLTTTTTTALNTFVSDPSLKLWQQFKTLINHYSSVIFGAR